MHDILQKRDIWRLWSFYSISFVCCRCLSFFLANGFKIDSQVDSGFQTLLDHKSRFHIHVDFGFLSPLDSGFQQQKFRGFRILLHGATNRSVCSLHKNMFIMICVIFTLVST